MSTVARLLPAVNDLARQQAHVVGRAQLLELGLTAARARSAVETGHWRRLLPGVYLTFDGPVSAAARLWAVLLAAGPGAVAGPRSTLWLSGLLDEPPEVFDVCVPHHRQVRGAPGMIVRRRRGLDSVSHPAGSPPRLRIEVAVLDVAAGAASEQSATDLVISAVQRRLTTAARLRLQLGRRRSHPRRRLLDEVLTEVQDGVRSALELRWVRTVERAHGLPRSTINASEQDRGRRRYRDVRYDRWGLVCELDGREAHPDDARFRDRERDNRVTVSGRRTLRYGWREVAADPCGIAVEVADVLRAHGWSGQLRPCSASCLARGGIPVPSGSRKSPTKGPHTAVNRS
jgi:hypothetical protein